MADSNMLGLLHKLAIRDLAERYAQTVDRRDFTGLALLLTEDCCIRSEEFSLSGRDAVVQGLQSGLARFDSTMHCVSTQLVSFDMHEGEMKGGEMDYAKAETYCVAHHLYQRRGELRKLSWGIRYQDELVQQHSSWRFVSRHLLIDWREDTALQQ